MGLLAHNALHDLLICLLDTAHVTTEAVLVQLLLGGLVPQAAGIRRDFVCENDLAVRSLAELELKVNEDDVQGIEVCFITSFTLKAIALMVSISSRVAAFSAIAW